MMSTTAIPILLGLIYFIFVKYVGPNYMANKKPYILRKALTIYNSAQILACIYLTVEVSNELFIETLIKLYIKY